MADNEQNYIYQLDEKAMVRKATVSQDIVATKHLTNTMSELKLEVWQPEHSDNNLLEETKEDPVVTTSR